MFNEGEVKLKDPDYIFCPAPHCKQILHLFTKHFCQHPLLPEQTETHTAEEIRKNVVLEMYNFCYARGLREVWGYMWTRWYLEVQWLLWARSASPRISRLRTTMIVKNFWKQLEGLHIDRYILKHDFLHHLLHLHLDHLVWILCTKVAPVWTTRAEALEDDYRAGRSK
ncbi:hypothetical protein OBBRIDRAFT_739263, partial [Obba rivulosa]